MKKMGTDALYQKPFLSKSSEEHKKYPYLLRGPVIKRPDRVWSGGIAYIRMRHGFVYPAAVTDWHSRYVLSHEISTAPDSGFCVTAL